MNISYNPNLSKISNWKIGGVANCLINIESLSDYTLALKYSRDHNIKPVIIGNTTNILFDDGFLDIAILKLGETFNNILINDEFIEVSAGVSCPDFARKMQINGVEGFEHIVGIPATIGGIVYMNVGSKRRLMSENILSVTSIDSNGKVITRENKECEFSYRNSIFQSLNELIVSVKLKYKKGSMDVIRKECLDILKDRRDKFPRKLPSCGSVFISDPEMYNSFGPPGKIIENLGLKGMVKGGAEISYKHANFIVNNGGAKSTDVLFLVKTIIDKVQDFYGFEMKSEGLFISKHGELMNLNSAVKIL